MLFGQMALTTDTEMKLLAMCAYLGYWGYLQSFGILAEYDSVRARMLSVVLLLISPFFFSFFPPSLTAFTSLLFRSSWLHCSWESIKNSWTDCHRTDDVMHILFIQNDSVHCHFTVDAKHGSSIKKKKRLDLLYFHSR